MPPVGDAGDDRARAGRDLDDAAAAPRVDDRRARAGALAADRPAPKNSVVLRTQRAEREPVDAGPERIDDACRPGRGERDRLAQRAVAVALAVVAVGDRVDREDAELLRGRDRGRREREQRRGEHRGASPDPSVAHRNLTSDGLGAATPRQVGLDGWTGHSARAM